MRGRPKDGEGFSDLHRDFFRPGGGREDGFSILWSTVVRRAARLVGDLCREVVHCPERDGWHRAHTPDLPEIDVPMLVCGSFSDQSLHSRGSFEAFRRAASKQKWLTTHRGGKWSTYDSADASSARLAFFDHPLKGVDDGWADVPRSS